MLSQVKLDPIRPWLDLASGDLQAQQRLLAAPRALAEGKGAYPPTEEDGLAINPYSRNQPPGPVL